MGKARAEIDIDRPADDGVGRGRGLRRHRHVDARASSRVTSTATTGCIKIMGMEVIERLERRDEESRELIYGIVGRRAGHQPQGHHHGDAARARARTSRGTWTSTTR